MVVHRGEIDACGGDDVAQRDVAKTAIGIKPFGGVEDRGPGLVRRHLMGPMQRGRCYSNSCMKLWFEGWNVNAHDVLPLQRPSYGRFCRRRHQRSKLTLRTRGGGGDSAANNFRPKM